MEILQIALIWRLLHSHFSEAIYFSWNNFISPFSQGYFQQSKLPSSFTAWKFMWCSMPSWVCWIQNKLLESNDFPDAPILWFLVTKSPDYDIGAENVKKEECWQNVLKGNENFAGHSYMPFLSFPCLPLCQGRLFWCPRQHKKDPDDDDCNAGDDKEFYGENVGRQNVSKGNENCAGRS